eukprot:Seg1918.5 transcript_id=Seg1918.5/GoldUCD/mRNA.D3Y31 product="ATP-dependent DNA helicase RecQ" protein_id=Seg1918.5/GoldUCD/D3Y31
MFHAGSPESVKSHVLAEMVQPESELRVLVCTIAFGMGINCKSVYRSIHFGPSTNIEMLVQETDMDEPDFEMVLESECENVDVVAESCEDDSTSNQLCDHHEPT